MMAPPTEHFFLTTRSHRVEIAGEPQTVHLLEPGFQFDLSESISRELRAAQMAVQRALAAIPVPDYVSMGDGKLIFQWDGSDEKVATIRTLNRRAFAGFLRVDEQGAHCDPALVMVTPNDPGVDAALATLREVIGDRFAARIDVRVTTLVFRSHRDVVMGKLLIPQMRTHEAFLAAGREAEQAVSDAEATLKMAEEALHRAQERQLAVLRCRFD